MREQPIPPEAMEVLADRENDERERRRGGRTSVSRTPVAGVRRGLPFFTEYGPTVPELPPEILRSDVHERRMEEKAPDLARLAGDFVPIEGATAWPSYRSRFVSGHLSLKEVDAPDLTIRKAPSGTVEVVVRYD